MLISGLCNLYCNKVRHKRLHKSACTYLHASLLLRVLHVSSIHVSWAWVCLRTRIEVKPGGEEMGGNPDGKGRDNDSIRHATVCRCLSLVQFAALALQIARALSYLHRMTDVRKLVSFYGLDMLCLITIVTTIY